MVSAHALCPHFLPLLPSASVRAVLSSPPTASSPESTSFSLNRMFSCCHSGHTASISESADWK